MGNGQPCFPGSIRDLVLVPLSVAQANHEASIPSTANNQQRRQLFDETAPQMQMSGTALSPNTSCPSHALAVDEYYTPTGGSKVHLVQSFYQNSNCTVYGRQTSVSQGTNVWKDGSGFIFNGDGSLKDQDNTVGCAGTPVVAYDNEIPFTPNSGPGHPYPFTNFGLSIDSACHTNQEADLYWDNVGS
jgi:hypothetical protein